MQLRGAQSDKKLLIGELEKAYLKASSAKDFYRLLEKEGLKIYYRNGKETGVVLKRKFRFRTLGYDREVLQQLEMKLSKNSRHNTLAKIRKNQQERTRRRER